jgi:ubiquinone/menaquinone biosynthesis C-methylase UbiE
MTHEDRILMVGCGNSKLSQQMYEAGYKKIVNIDISPSVIEQMRKASPDMEWTVMDATQLTYGNEEFDFVIDKGTMDALISGKDYDICTKMLSESMRVADRDGQLILITYGSP